MWAKGMQQITDGGHGQMSVDMALETYMSHWGTGWKFPGNTGNQTPVSNTPCYLFISHVIIVIPSWCFSIGKVLVK